MFLPAIPVILNHILRIAVLKLRLRERRVNEKFNYNVPQCGSSETQSRNGDNILFQVPWFARTLPSLWMSENIPIKVQVSLMTPFSTYGKKWLSTNRRGCFLCVQPLSCSLILGKCTDPNLLWLKYTMGWHSHIQF